MSEDLFGEPVINDKIIGKPYFFPLLSLINTQINGWSQRKSEWKELGIRSEVGRDASCINMMINREDIKQQANYTSVFDPVLCELIYNWFCPKGGLILDPFAGGSVRGIVANYLGYKYIGCELREEQVISNQEQAKEILPNNKPTWYTGDSDETLGGLMHRFDFVFSCPPYHDLEVYSEDPNDLSNMDYPTFLAKYESIIKKSLALLKPNRFAVFVVGDMRDKVGFYKLFPQETIAAFVKNGASFYNDMVLMNHIGSASLRVGGNMVTRKVAKIHQNILVFYKGDTSKIPEIK